MSVLTNHTVQGQSFDDSAELILGGNRLGNRSRGLPESHVLRSSSTDKERANNVAKIKVVVCFVLRVSFLCLLHFAFCFLVIKVLSFSSCSSCILTESATYCCRFGRDHKIRGK